MTSKFWKQADAIKMCRLLESVAPAYGCHVALTGGCLYKDGPRKDADVIFYRIRQVENIDVASLLGHLEALGFAIMDDTGWRVSVVYKGGVVDLLFPERFGVPADASDYESR